MSHKKETNLVAITLRRTSSATRMAHNWIGPSGSDTRVRDLPSTRPSSPEHALPDRVPPAMDTRRLDSCGDVVRRVTSRPGEDR